MKIAQKQLDIPLPGQPAVALVLGYDRRVGDPATGSRSDTIMLVRVDPHTKTISLFSFPRDLIVPIWCKHRAVRLRQDQLGLRDAAARRARSRRSRS